MNYEGHDHLRFGWKVLKGSVVVEWRVLGRMRVVSENEEEQSRVSELGRVVTVADRMEACYSFLMVSLATSLLSSSFEG